MNILVVGLNHKSAPVDIREKLAFDNAETAQALMQLKIKYPSSEFVILSTCNRIEIYSAAPKEVLSLASLVEFLSKFRDVPVADFQDYIYVHEEAETVKHLFCVTSSLDSMVVGENQILGQVKESYLIACKVKSTGKILNRLFHSAFATGKKVHTNTDISSGRVSIAGVAVELATQLFADVSSAKVVVIGAGKMGDLLVKHLLHVGCSNIVIANRSYERAVRMAEQYSINALEWKDIVPQFVDVDIVISSAGSQSYLFNKEILSKIMRRRRKGALLVIDVAVPRNFDPDVNKLEDIYLYSIDELTDVADRNRKERENDIIKGFEIITDSVLRFMDWFKSRDIGPLIGEMKFKFGEISQKEMDSFFVGTREEASCKEMVETMMHRVVNRLLHCVIKNINYVSNEYGPSEAVKFVDSIVEQAKEALADKENNGNE